MPRLRLTVRNPCPDMRWEEMTGDGARRHCTTCNKNVHNLSAMHPREARTLLDAGQRICVRFFHRDSEVLHLLPTRRKGGASRLPTGVALLALVACSPHTGPDAAPGSGTETGALEDRAPEHVIPAQREAKDACDPEEFEIEPDEPSNEAEAAPDPRKRKTKKRARKRRKHKIQISGGDDPLG